MRETQKVVKPHIFRISMAAEIGQKKHNVKSAILKAGEGIKGDAHSGSARPVSLLPFESFKKLEHPDLDIRPGDFAENITTLGVDFAKLTIGTKLLLGQAVKVEIIQIGKECHLGCIIRETVGDCIMPREGVFAQVLTGGEIKEGDPVRILG